MIENTIFPDCKLITPTIHKDKRGHFLETFTQEYYAHLLNFNLYQINESYSHYGVIRGLHAQKEPFAQAKIIRVLSGKILDVIVDMRPKSSFFTRSMSIFMDDNKKQQLFIPKGFLHGYAVLSDSAIIQYYIDQAYSPAHEIGVRYDDSQLNIDWIVTPSNRIISNKDLDLPTLDQIIS